MRPGGCAVAAKWPLCHSKMALSSHRGRAVTTKGEGHGERKWKKGGSVTGLRRLSGPVGILLFRVFVVL